MSKAAILAGAAALLAIVAVGCDGDGGRAEVIIPMPIRPGNVWDGASPYLVRRTAGPVAIDSEYHGDQWANAMVMTDFTVPPSGQRASNQTEVRMLWDDENLYVHFVAYDADLCAKATGKTPQLWLEDCVEVFLQPDVDGISYNEFEVSPINSLLALQIANTRQGTLEQRADWPHSVRCATRAVGTVNQPADDDQFYAVVLAVPFKDLKFAGNKAPSPGTIWKFLASRCNQSRTFGPDGEPSACVPLPEVDFHINPHYPQMKFVE